MNILTKIQSISWDCYRVSFIHGDIVREKVMSELHMKILPIERFTISQVRDDV